MRKGRDGRRPLKRRTLVPIECNHPCTHVHKQKNMHKHDKTHTSKRLVRMHTFVGTDLNSILVLVVKKLKYRLSKLKFQFMGINRPHPRFFQKWYYMGSIKIIKVKLGLFAVVRGEGGLGVDHRAQPVFHSLNITFRIFSSCFHLDQNWVKMG